ncbi:MAG: RloB family protein [Chlorobium sp.]
MARDNHPKIRQDKKLQRKKALKKGADRLLIVTEGEKTEPYYFGEIRMHYRLSTARVEIMQSKYGTTPQQVVDFAVDKCNETKEYESVYCVFDRDDHPNFLNRYRTYSSKLCFVKKFLNMNSYPVALLRGR